MFQISNTLHKEACTAYDKGLHVLHMPFDHISSLENLTYPGMTLLFTIPFEIVGVIKDSNGTSQKCLGIDLTTININTNNILYTNFVYIRVAIQSRNVTRVRVVASLISL